MRFEASAVTPDGAVDPWYGEEEEFDWYEEYIREGEEIERYVLWRWEDLEDRLAAPRSSSRFHSSPRRPLSRAMVSGIS